MIDWGLADDERPHRPGLPPSTSRPRRLTSGLVACRAGTMMASCDEFCITITGRGGHASMPHDATDPVPVVCEIVTALQAMVTRVLPAFDPAVLTVTRITAGTAFNVIPETVTCDGTIRSVSDGSRDLAIAGLLQVAEHVAAAHVLPG